MFFIRTYFNNFRTYFSAPRKALTISRKMQSRKRNNISSFYFFPLLPWFTFSKTIIKIDSITFYLIVTNTEKIILKITLSNSEKLQLIINFLDCQSKEITYSTEKLKKWLK